MNFLHVDTINALIRFGARSINTAHGKVRLGGSKRLNTFATKGTECVTCGRNATHYTFEYDAHGLSSHLNLYSDDVLMTIDHIIPKSVGGTDHADNLQPMCYPCNQKKACNLPVGIEISNTMLKKL